MRRSKLVEMFRDIISSLDDRNIESHKIPNFDDFLKLLILRNIGTPYILLNPHICKACWKCVKLCPRSVIGKVDFLIHKHAKIKKADACIGCMKCFNVCEYKAIYKINYKS